MTDNDSRHADYLMTFQEEDEKHFRFLITIRALLLLKFQFWYAFKCRTFFRESANMLIDFCPECSGPKHVKNLGLTNRFPVCLQIFMCLLNF